jgi:hypothetical protein
MPVDLDARVLERQYDPAGADREFERLALTGELGEKRRRFLLVATGLGGVVALGRLVAEAYPGVEAFHQCPLVVNRGDTREARTNHSKRDSRDDRRVAATLAAPSTGKADSVASRRSAASRSS